MNTPEIEAFLTDLAVNRTVSASTQNQAFAALLFLYREVLHIELLQPIDALHAKSSKHLPTVLSRTEVHLLLQQIVAVHALMAQLLYGRGLRSLA